MKKILMMIGLIMTHYVSAAQLTIIDGSNIIHSYSDQELLKMAQRKIVTELPWLEGESEFSGVTIQELFKQSNLAIPERMTFTALNNYEVVIDKVDIEKYKPIIAIMKNGEKMSIREKGPFWVIFPISDQPSIDTTHYHSKMIWQLKEVHL